MSLRPRCRLLLNRADNDGDCVRAELRVWWGKGHRGLSITRSGGADGGRTGHDRVQEVLRDWGVTSR